MKNSKNLLKLKNIKKISDDLVKFINFQVIENYKKNGVVIGLSGGLDSSLTASLSVKSLGKENVLGLILPEKESSPSSYKLAKSLANKLKIKYEVVDITKILDSYQVYKNRENIVKKYFTKFNQKCKYGLSIPQYNLVNSGLRIPFLEVEDTKKQIHKFKIAPYDFTTLSSLTSIKHRTRMTILYSYAEKNNLVVVGSTNKSEYAQGYFVKYGDGGVDIEPIQNLYKTQVYELGHYLRLPNKVLQRKASPDTWSLETSDEEFFYGMDYEILDLLLYGLEKKFSLEKISKLINIDKTQVKIMIKNLQKRKNFSSHMRKLPPSLRL
tara:strand:+ start:514 stop:1485 length:972 start_codon:yes stop_codon:yes gene_type:complete